MNGSVVCDLGHTVITAFSREGTRHNEGSREARLLSATAPSSGGLSAATFSRGEKVAPQLLPALAPHREPDGFFRGAEQGPRLVAAFVVFSCGGRIVDNPGACLHVHEAVLHH
jgi:hypothetical protein